MRDTIDAGDFWRAVQMGHARSTYSTSTLTAGRKRTMTIPWGTVAEFLIAAILLVYVIHVW